MPYIQNHPLLEPLPKIEHHNQLTVNQIKLAELPYTEMHAGNSYTKTYSLIQQNNQLSVLVSFHYGHDKKYGCAQYDFPLAVLSWFPKTLEKFRNGEKFEEPGGTGMTTPDINVDGEFLTVSRSTSGYHLSNWSRNSSLDEEGFAPVTLPLTEDFLYKQGLLDTWIKLGERFENGTL